MKSLLLLTLLIAGCAEARPSHSAPYAVRLEFEGGAVCSATAVGRNILLGASHCWGDADKTKRRLSKVNGQDAYALEIIRDGKDHALVRVSTQFTRWAVMGPAVVQGDRISMNGNAAGEPDLYREGYVVRVKPDQVLIDMQGFSGDSGAGVFDSRGRVVGVVSAGLLWMGRGTPHHMALTVVWPLAFTDENWRDIRA